MKIFISSFIILIAIQLVRCAEEPIGDANGFQAMLQDGLIGKFISPWMEMVKSGGLFKTPDRRMGDGVKITDQVDYEIPDGRSDGSNGPDV